MCSITGWEDPLEKEMATHSSIFAWKIPWREEPNGLLGVVRTGYDLATEQRQHTQNNFKRETINWSSCLLSPYDHVCWKRVSISLIYVLKLNLISVLPWFLLLCFCDSTNIGFFLLFLVDPLLMSIPHVFLECLKAMSRVTEAPKQNKHFIRKCFSKDVLFNLCWEENGSFPRQGGWRGW